jgi:hypothetical protein
MIPIPFSTRTTSAAAVFACIFIASPQGAPKLTTYATYLGALQIEYSMLINIYPVLIHQDTANNQADLYAAIAKAVAIVQSLNTTLDAIVATGDAGIVLAGMQQVAAHALTNLLAVQSDE